MRLKIPFPFLKMELLTAILLVLFAKGKSSATKAAWFHERTVVRGQAELPCLVPDPRQPLDKALLVLWYKEDLPLEPVYSYDTRNGPFHKGVRWADSSYLGSRAFFRINSDPPTLVVEDVKVADEGTYTCRVDYKIRLSAYTKINLTVIVPPGPPLILDDKGRELRGRIGPLTEGMRVHMECKSVGGNPSPELTWWRNGHRLRQVSNSVIEKSESHITIVASRDLHGSMITCQALNNNITEPSSTSLVINVLLSPLSVEIVGNFGSLSAGRPVELVCRAIGSRPPAHIIWLKGKQQIMDVTHTVMNGGNVTTGSIILIPKLSDHSSTVTCRASNPDIADSTIEDHRLLTVLYKPQVNLSLGRPLKADNIKSGDDVYFECSIRANPPITRVSWHHNGLILTTNKSGGLIISGQSLVLQSIDRSRSGNYTCAAHNSEGHGMSNPVLLKVMFSPICAHSEKRTQGVARSESAQVSCEVQAYPPQVNFTWKFNGSSEGEMLPLNNIKSRGTSSTLNYTVNMEKDFGTLLCWAINKIGVQEEPCVVHLIPASEFESAPDPPRNCSIANQTSEALVVECSPGYDGGIEQTFLMEAWAQGKLLSNMSSASPEFVVRGLDPGMGVSIKIRAVNIQGQSAQVKLEADIMKVAEKRMEILPGPPEETSVPPVVGAVVGGVAAFLILILVGLLLTRYAHRPWSSNQRERLAHAQDKSPKSQMTDVYHQQINEEEERIHSELRQKESPDLVCGTVLNDSVRKFSEVPRLGSSPSPVGVPVELQGPSMKHNTCSSLRFMDTMAVLQEMSSGATTTVPDTFRQSTGAHFPDYGRHTEQIDFRRQESPDPHKQGSPHVHFQPPPPFNDSPPQPRNLMRQLSSNFPHLTQGHLSARDVERCWNIGSSAAMASSLHDLTSAGQFDGVPNPSMPCYGTLDRRKMTQQSPSTRTIGPILPGSHQESSV